MKNDALNELLSKNNIAAPSNIVQAPSIGGKRTQTLIDEYKSKAAKAKEESDKKTAELLQKSKKITELQSTMKRDEAHLKKNMEEVIKLRKQLSNQKVSERLIVQPVAMAGAKAGSKAKGEQQVPDAEEIKNQFMDKLTSQLENYFAADDDAEGASTSAGESQAAAPEDESSMINTSADNQAAEGAIAEANRATSLEEKEKLLSAVK